MSAIRILDPHPAQEQASAADAVDCQECLGTGGWYRYEPAAESGPGTLYLSCVQCRGSGRSLLPLDAVLRAG